jgi:predicted NBD/HSP70 family sugar kinase
VSPPRNVQALVRRTHEERVLAVLRERGGLSRAEIAERVGLSRTTLSEITGDLIARGAVVVVATEAAQRTGSGRRAELLALDPDSGQYVGVDLGHSRVRVVVADAAREVIASGVREYDVTGAGAQAEAGIALIEELAAELGLHFGALQGVAVGVTGTDVATRRAVHAAYAAWTGAPVLTDNNTRFAALAEATTDAEADGTPGELVYLRLAEGVGGGLVVGGRLVAGGRGAAGELGHVRVDHSAQALRCRCGRTGCLETVASVPAILRASGVTRLEDASTERAEAAVAEVVTTAALVLSPTQVVIGGPLVRLRPDFVERVTRAVQDELEDVGSGPPAIRAARLGDDDGALGAIAALVQHSPLLAGYSEPLDSTHANDDPRSARA